MVKFFQIFILIKYRNIWNVFFLVIYFIYLWIGNLCNISYVLIKCDREVKFSLLVKEQEIVICCSVYNMVNVIKDIN